MARAWLPWLFYSLAAALRYDQEDYHGGVTLASNATISGDGVLTSSPLSAAVVGPSAWLPGALEAAIVAALADLHLCGLLILLLGCATALALPSGLLLPLSLALACCSLVASWCLRERLAFCLGCGVVFALYIEVVQQVYCMARQSACGRALAGAVFGSAAAASKGRGAAGTLKFYQVAASMPDLLGAERDEKNNVVVQIDGRSETLHIPTASELTGRTNSDGTLLLEELERWLGRHGIHQREQRPALLAVNIMRFASGARESFADGLVLCLQEEEWARVSGRVALFLHLDADGDARLSQEEAQTSMRVDGGVSDDANPFSRTCLRTGRL